MWYNGCRRDFMKKETIFRIIITLIITSILYYFILPPLNIQSMFFWIFLLIIAFIYYITGILEITNIQQVIVRRFSNKKRISNYIILGLLGIFFLILLINMFYSPFFQANKYQQRITVFENGNFTEDVSLVDFNAIPLLDKESSQKLGDRVMGQMPELVSQFTVSSLYTQINYQSEIIRVTPLEYASVFKFFANQKEGVKGYITVNSVTGESKLIKLENGMKYMPSALFSKNLYRHLRFQYPTEIFGQESFEIDNEGNPYWIIPTLSYHAIGRLEDVDGVVIVDPITGDCKKYDVEDVPTWVDHVYSANLIIEQVNDWGRYKNGYLNSIFGQKDVVATTSGYNYTVMNDDVYLYTGITSAASDEANLGFILTNMRTKETVFYSVPGAEEYSAMASAEGQVQQMNYKATFPLLINLNNKPTYLISLKDNAGLVKMYAFVDVVDYQKVSVTDVSQGIEQAALNYLGESMIYDDASLVTKTIQIQKIELAMIDGNTYYYIVSKDGNRYRASIKVNMYDLPFLKVGDDIEVTYQENTEIREIIKLK